MTQGEIRIIGGQWRGRKIKVLPAPNLRPTPNRVRETLFNWLAPYIHHSYCLDAFAGSGALGFEALSRGAAHVVMVDQSKHITQLLTEEARIFKTEHAEIYCAEVPKNLKKPQHLFNIVFLDPPFHENLLLATCFYLADNHFLAPSALIYLESKDPIQEHDLPSNWKILKIKKAGDVYYHLAQSNE